MQSGLVKYLESLHDPNS